MYSISMKGIRMKIIQKTKRREAITLLALVITIVIMLLLAAIAIQMALGENGLIIKASKAKKESQQAEIKERLQTTVIRHY